MSWRLHSALLGLWPSARPDLEVVEHGWLNRGNKRALQRAVAAGVAAAAAAASSTPAPGTTGTTTSNAIVVVELGSWLGRSARYLLEILPPSASLFCVDTWDKDLLLGAKLDQYQVSAAAMAVLENVACLLAQFQVNTWDLRHRLFPLKMDSVAGLRLLHGVGHRGGHRERGHDEERGGACASTLAPLLIYVDACHEYGSVLADLRACRALFPGATIVGDDWVWPSVRRAVRDFLLPPEGREGGAGGEEGRGGAEEGEEKGSGEGQSGEGSAGGYRLEHPQRKDRPRTGGAGGASGASGEGDETSKDGRCPFLEAAVYDNDDDNWFILWPSPEIPDVGVNASSSPSPSAYRSSSKIGGSSTSSSGGGGSGSNSGSSGSNSGKSSGSSSSGGSSGPDSVSTDGTRKRRLGVEGKGGNGGAPPVDEGRHPKHRSHSSS